VASEREGRHFALNPQMIDGAYRLFGASESSLEGCNSRSVAFWQDIFSSEDSFFADLEHVSWLEMS
jgi:hypothetical protein